MQLQLLSLTYSRISIRRRSLTQYYCNIFVTISISFIVKLNKYCPFIYCKKIYNILTIQYYPPDIYIPMLRWQDSLVKFLVNSFCVCMYLYKLLCLVRICSFVSKMVRFCASRGSKWIRKQICVASTRIPKREE